jgi:hypothetical protein
MLQLDGVGSSALVTEGMMAEDKVRKVIVTGDVTMDWNLLHTGDARAGERVWDASVCTRACWQPGGAALLGAVMKQVAARLPRRPASSVEVLTVSVPGRTVSPGDLRYRHSYAIWFDSKERIHQMA